MQPCDPSRMYSNDYLGSGPDVFFWFDLVWTLGCLLSSKVSSNVIWSLVSGDGKSMAPSALAYHGYFDLLSRMLTW